MALYGKSKKADAKGKKGKPIPGGMKGVMADHFRNNRFKKGKKR